MPHDRDALRVLVEKVRGATGPDRDLDAEIWWLFADHGNTNRAIMAWAGKRGVVYALGRFAGSTWRAQPWLPGYTASLDAALALVERVLPAWEWQAGLYMGEHGQAVVRAPDAADDPYQIEFAQTPPLALLSALLTALLVQAEAEAGGQHVQ